MLASLVASGGCASYTERLEDVRVRVDGGDYPGAIDDLNDVLGVDSTEELPDRWNHDRPLAVLERGALLQATGAFEASARDLGAGEEELELLEIERDTVGQIGTFVYSDSARNYRTPPTERLALNAVNMLNYLALGDAGGAAVEARRYTVMGEYLESLDLRGQASFGSYLAGIAFEQLGEGDRALRYYEEAMRAGVLASLKEPVARLARAHPYRGPRIRALLAEGEATGPARPSELVTVVSLGRVPYKVAERLPIGLAVGIAGSWLTGNPDVLARSAFKVVVYPELVAARPRRQARVAVDGQPGTLETLSRLGSDIRREYEKVKPRIIGAALTRMITRAAAAEGARYAGRQAGGGAGDIVGLLAALLSEGVLVSLDKPDTRSWTMLADEVLVSRRVVAPGAHEVEVRIEGPGFTATRTRRAEVPPGGIAVVVFTEPR